MPQYGALVDGSRTLAKLKQPIRAIRTEFTLPATSDEGFVFWILGGRLDPALPWIAVIAADGRISYQRVTGS